MLKTQHYLLLILFIFLSSTPSPAQKPSNWYPVSKIVDGDTFWIINAKGEKEKIRLIGVDAPESRKSGKKEIGFYGKESKIYLEQILTGKKVRLEYDVSKYDRYKRTLAYVYLENGTFLNVYLIQNGYASVMTVPPNVRFAEQFVQLQKEAREKKRGLWK